MSAPAQPASATFVDAIRALGGNARVVSNSASAADAVETAVRKHGAGSTLLYEPDGLIEDLKLGLALRARGIQLVPVADAGADAALHGAGLTRAELAVAQSGSLLVGGELGGWGLAACLPRVHVAIVRAEDIEPDLAAAFPRFERACADGRRNWVWVSGPSKTGDIAMQLVKGVHGPNAIEVVILDEGRAT